MAGISIETVRAAGVVGAGGAGFPTHVKLSGKADTLILNAAECEPLLHKDKQLLDAYTEQIVEAVAAGMQLVGATEGIIGVKGKHADLIDSIRPKLAGNMRIGELADAYPVGDEFILTYDTTGRVIPPGGIPLNVGVVVVNVETALNVSASPDRPVTVKYVSVAGAVDRPTTLAVPVGVTLDECVAAAGGATIDDPNYVVGGVMMGRLEPDAGALVTKTTGAVIVLPSDHVVVRRMGRPWQSVARIARSACDQCSFCTQMCPPYLLGHPIAPHIAMRSLAFSPTSQSDVKGTLFCCQCNLCSMWSCPESLDPQAVCAQNKQRILAAGDRWPDAPINDSRPELLMDNRRAPITGLMRRLDLTQFQNAGPLAGNAVATDKVGIKRSQHIGAPCESAVSVGASVKVGDLVGRPPVTDGKPALGAPVHASIDGKVTRIADGVVWIEK